MRRMEWWKEEVEYKRKALAEAIESLLWAEKDGDEVDRDEAADDVEVARWALKEAAMKYEGLAEDEAEDFAESSATEIERELAGWYNA